SRRLSPCPRRCVAVALRCVEATPRGIRESANCCRPIMASTSAPTHRAGAVHFESPADFGALWLPSGAGHGTLSALEWRRETARASPRATLLRTPRGGARCGGDFRFGELFLLALGSGFARLFALMQGYLIFSVVFATFVAIASVRLVRQGE